MTLEEALGDIKSHDFAARVGIASDLGTFLRVAQHEESVDTLIALLVSEENQLRVLREVLDLSAASVDHRYENPHDSAIAVLVWALSRMAPNVSGVAAQSAVEAPQCWWAWKVGDSVLTGIGASREAADASLSSGVTYDAMDAGVEYRMLRGSVVGTLHVAAGLHLYAFSSWIDAPDERAGGRTLRASDCEYTAVATTESTVTPVMETLAS